MLAQVAIVPSAPVLLPELSGPDAPEVIDVRAAALAAAESLGTAAERWVAIGADGPNRRFSSYGVDVPVTLRAGGDDERSPLSMLIAAWLRGQTSPAASIRPLVVDPSWTPQEAASAGFDLAASIGDYPIPVGVLVVADGATALTPSAPGGGDRPSAHALQRTVDDAIASVDLEALAALDPAACEADGVGGRVALQVLAALARGHEMTSELRYADAPLGVGYTVATWTPR
ncbi:hypothetical protein SAMN04488550_1985 [Gordonia malaquae]|uniref:Extradiol ring-cleavage dioxygenase class III enzyme subunit B domain-containing protein n=1 Tax=Gordonia malaquae NBRC 108250 TaxID=1223542 RepID=M3UX84_GORML|nr:hypothetical protein [Gordonia malaquae]GAC80317.1 hypothetical protein GM1_016_00780 [Gordonia malaquae NBRC 108250]SEC54264.1 hypothetical protein SAMN04488550_1985 [Gordonia malaquae]